MPQTKSRSNPINLIAPWVKGALSNEAFFRDGMVTWRKATPSASARSERLKVLRFLVKHAFVKPELKYIGEKLRYCSPGNRCYCALCSECGRALQRFFVSECKPLFEQGKTCVASIIDSRMSDRADLRDFSANSLMNRVKAILRKGGVKLAAGGIDFSFNQDTTGIFESHWCAHLWLILPNSGRDRWEPALRLANPASESCPRPIRIEKWDGQDEALAYALKTSFKRRVTVIASRRQNGKPQRDTSEQELRVSEKIPLYQYLESAGLHSRVFLLGVRPTLTIEGFSLVKLES